MSDSRQFGKPARYEALLATLIGLCALTVSSYTAWTQHQQMRAAIWPILEYSTSNEPCLRLTLANKGMGPAIIRHVVVKVDGKPVSDWRVALEKLLGPGTHHFSFSTLGGRVLSPGESTDFLIPLDVDGNQLKPRDSGPLGVQMNQARDRVSLEVCYASTLGECWLLRGGAAASSNEPCSCPKPGATTFHD